ncbi:MAG: hypothetical protein K9L17_06665 [Clostridiales bacterium]|nr:hypothetical protein [Clostridiales bacterium]MCF8022355.1 hypothetical protein [Clostridiales bacterium]
MNWDQRDKKLLVEVRKAVKMLYHLEKPVQINISRVGREIGKQALFERHLDKLPLTSEYLNQVIETREQFQIRWTITNPKDWSIL